MPDIIKEIRMAWRTIRNAPTVAVVGILTIAVGIGANTTIFSWIRSLLLNPLPGASEPARIVAIENTAPNGEPITTSYLDFRDFRDNLKLVNYVTAYRGYVFSVGDAPDTERVWGEVASGGMFDMLGIRPEAARRLAERARRCGDQPRLLEVALPFRSIGSRQQSSHQSNAVHDYRRGAGSFPRNSLGARLFLLGAAYDVWPVNAYRHVDAE